MNYSIVRLDTFYELIGPELFSSKISDYVCSKDSDVEKYLKEKSLHHTRHDVSKTFLAVNDNFDVLGYYTLAIKCIAIPEMNEKLEVSRTFYRNLNVHDGVVQSFLVGQLSRADYSNKGLGAELLNLALAMLNSIRTNIGCNAVRIDCHENMVDYYRSKGFRFIKNDVKTGLCQMLTILKS